MKFTVGMLDASAVFLKDKDSKTTTPTIARDQAGKDVQKEKGKDQERDLKVDRAMHEYGQTYYESDEVSPSVGHSTESTYPYDTEFAGTGFTPDNRPSWAGFANPVNFTAGDVQDWSLDQLYNFDDMHGVEDMLGNRRTIQEYDETGNIFAGF